MVEKDSAKENGPFLRERTTTRRFSLLSSNCDCLVWEDSLQTKASMSSRGESNYFDSLLLGLREQGNQIGKTREIYVADRNASNLRSAKTNYVKSEMFRRSHFGNV
jgi:hypothetical protein